MAGRIKGITVEINGDTTKLSKALEGVNKNIKNTQTQLKDVEKLLKLDPTNTEEKVLKAIENAIGTAVDESSIAAVERVVVVGEEITVEKT